MQKFLTKGAGILQEVQTDHESAGAGDAGKIRCLDESGLLDISVMPLGTVTASLLAEATEDLVIGDVVYLHKVVTTLTADKADATDATKKAMGYIDEIVDFSGEATCRVYFEGLITLTGLTPGAKYYLTTTPGVISVAPPEGDGNMVQCVGYALSATKLKFDPDDVPIVLEVP